MGRGSDSLDALRAIWMEGYRRGLAEGASGRKLPLVDITHEDLARTFEHGSCGNPNCPACSTVRLLNGEAK